VVDSAEIKNKDEWISRIRKLNGQRDPTKEITPEEQAQQFAEAQKAALQGKMAMQQLALGLKKLEGEISKMDADAITQRVNGLYTALQAAQIVAVTPAVAPVADVIAQGAGFKDQGGQDPNIPAAAQPAAPSLENLPVTNPAPQEQAPPAPMQPPGMQQAI